MVFSWFSSGLERSVVTSQQNDLGGGCYRFVINSLGISLVILGDWFDDSLQTKQQVFWVNQAKASPERWCFSQYGLGLVKLV
jgi:hypothetical protein